MLRVGTLTVLLAGIFFLAPIPERWVEHIYSRELYLAWQNVLTPISSLVSFALFDLLVVGILVALVVWWTVVLRGSRGRGFRIFVRMTFNTIAALAGIYVIFLLVWGLNYRREPLTSKLDFDPKRITPDALVELTTNVVKRLNMLYLPARQLGWARLEEFPSRFAPAFDQAQRQLGNNRTAVVGKPKTSLLTYYFRRAGIDGMMNPFSLEILVNETVLPFERPLVVAHEWAHLAGYAEESEASFVGWLTCLAGDDTSRYSAWLFLLPQLVRYLEQSDQAATWDQLKPGPTEDLRAVAARFTEVVPVVQRNANRVYDRYLRAHGVEAGIASYGEVVNLVIGTQPWWVEQ